MVAGNDRLHSLPACTDEEKFNAEDTASGPSGTTPGIVSLQKKAGLCRMYP